MSAVLRLEIKCIHSFLIRTFIMSSIGASDSVTDKRIVLVVDDTPDNLSIMSGLLKDEYKVKVANSGERALKIANAEPAPHLILLDIMMPEMDGFEVIRRLKAEPKTQPIPVIFLSAKALPEDKQKGFALGAIDYITKPIDPVMILERVKAHIY
jgi:putative two-component system response regulator